MLLCNKKVLEQSIAVRSTLRWEGDVLVVGSEPGVRKFTAGDVQEEICRRSEFEEPVSSKRELRFIVRYEVLALISRITRGTDPAAWLEPGDVTQFAIIHLECPFPKAS